MKILHTSDIHLTGRENPHFQERWNALEEVIRVSKDVKADVVVISGDLFDNSLAGEVLRGDVRGVFEGTDSRVIVLSGNHDRDVFSHGNFYGENVIILDEASPVEEIDGVEFWGIPFFEGNSAQIALKVGEIAKQVKNPEKSILILHGELLDISEGWGVYGDEGRERYFPFKLSYFTSRSEEEIGWKYILAGHFHSSFIVKSIKVHGKKGAYFVYPGSPVSVTEKERGKRSVNIFEFGGEPKKFPVNSFYYEEVKVKLSPFDSLLPLDRIKQAIEEKKPGNFAKLLVDIEGFYDSEKNGMGEDQLIPRIKELLHNWRLAREPVIRLRNIERILRDEIYEAFDKKLEDEPIREEEKGVIKEFMIKAMIESI